MNNGNKPISPIVGFDGLTKREYYAGLAMQAITTGARMMKGDPDYYADLAVKSADALLKALEMPASRQEETQHD